jgi:hypothetical protein
MINTRKLRLAIKAGDIDQITATLRDAGKSEIRLAYEWTPLHVAVKSAKRKRGCGNRKCWC